MTVIYLYISGRPCLSSQAAGDRTFWYHWHRARHCLGFLLFNLCKPVAARWFLCCMSMHYTDGLTPNSRHCVVHSGLSIVRLKIGSFFLVWHRYLFYHYHSLQQSLFAISRNKSCLCIAQIRFTGTLYPKASQLFSMEDKVNNEHHPLVYWWFWIFGRCAWLLVLHGA